MTRLTNELRRSIISKIMSNVPMIDYREQIKVLLNETARAIAPPEIMALHGTPNWQYASTVRVYISREGYFWVCPIPNSDHETLGPTHPNPEWRKLYAVISKADLIGATERQIKARKTLEDELMQVMQSTTTVKGLRSVLSPDLHQFVPIDVELKANLPVPAVVAKLKAMGMTFPEPTSGGNTNG